MNLQIVVAGTEVVSALAVTFTLIAMIKHPAEHQVIEGSGGRFPGGSHQWSGNGVARCGIRHF
jgi:hypothetical protein